MVEKWFCDKCGADITDLRKFLDVVNTEIMTPSGQELNRESEFSADHCVDCHEDFINMIRKWAAQK